MKPDTQKERIYKGIHIFYDPTGHWNAEHTKRMSHWYISEKINIQQNSGPKEALWHHYGETIKEMKAHINLMITQKDRKFK